MPEPGRTAVVVPVPALDPALTALGRRWPATVRPGVPAHLTVLYPFVPADALTDDDVDRARALCAGTGPLRVRFDRVVVTGSMVAAAPDPATALRALTRAFAAAWPQHPPYGGRFGPDPDPHLTLALDPGPDRDAIAAAADAVLPVEAGLIGAILVELTADGWRQRAELPF